MAPEWLVNATFIALIVTGAVSTLCLVVLIAYVIKTWELAAALRRTADSAGAGTGENARHAERLAAEMAALRTVLADLPQQLASAAPAAPSAPAAPARSTVPNSPVAAAPIAPAPDPRPAPEPKPAPEPRPEDLAAAREWRGQVEAELKEFRALWCAFYGGRRERLREPNLGNLQAAATDVAQNLVWLLARRPETAAAPPATMLLGIIAGIQEVARFDLDLDTGPSVDHFNERGDEIVRRIDSLGR